MKVEKIKTTFIGCSADPSFRVEFADSAGRTVTAIFHSFQCIGTVLKSPVPLTANERSELERDAYGLDTTRIYKTCLYHMHKGKEHLELNAKYYR